jgi:hypothetical protein
VNVPLLERDEVELSKTGYGQSRIIITQIGAWSAGNHRQKSELASRKKMKLQDMISTQHSAAKALLAVAFLMSTAPTSYAQRQRSPQPVQIDVRRFMTAGEFNAAGLDKLSSQELAVLNQWLGKFTQQILQAAQGGGSCSSVIESQIDGTFQGWSGETVFKLTNGQIWQQSI